METRKNLLCLLPCLPNDFRLDFSERLNEKRKNRKKEIFKRKN